MDRIKQFEPLWGVWKIEKPLGEGSFGKVYRASREDFGKKYYAAIKHISIPASETQITDSISEGYATNAEMAKDYFDEITHNLIGEITLMNEVKGHTNIVSYEDHLIIPKRSGIGYDIFIRMELLTGLSEIMRKSHLTETDVIELGIDICSALEVCLEKGIIHRDIKPSNIFVNDLGNYKLGDFGVSRQLEHTTMGMSKKGTYVYMAPEVYHGESANFSADTYSLGIVMYRLMNGNRAPFLPTNTPSIKPGDSERSIVRRMSGEPLNAPAYASKQLSKIILKATQYDRGKRYSSPTEMKNDLQKLYANAERFKLHNINYESDHETKQVNNPPLKNTNKIDVSENKASASLSADKTSAKKRPVKKWLLSAIASILVIASLAATLSFGLFSGSQSSTAASFDEGKVLNIYSFNDEFKILFEKYYKVPKGVTVNWILADDFNDNDDFYQKLEAALQRQNEASADAKIDLFIAEADYVTQYADSDYSMSIDEIGFRNASTMYQYTIDAATDSRTGKCKGVSFQCCPSGIVYRRSIAREVLGTDVPTIVQGHLSDWDKFMDTAALAKEKGYYIIPNYYNTYYAFANNRTLPWVDSNNTMLFDNALIEWLDRMVILADAGSISNVSLWDGSEQGDDGRTMCFFAPSWYYGGIMTTARTETFGDWAICKGPQTHFWGGSWLMAAKGTDNPKIIKDIFETFTINEEVCSRLLTEDNQYPNNKSVARSFADSSTYGNDFLGGQNDIAVLYDVAEDIKWENHTEYDLYLDNGVQYWFDQYFNGEISLEDAFYYFFMDVIDTYPEIIIDPEKTIDPEL